MNIESGGYMKNKTDKKIPISNYVKLVLGIIVTIAIVLIIRNGYLNSVNYELSQSIISETLISEINQEEVYNYIRENENSILYVGVVSNEECREFETEFNTVIKDKMLEDKITYLNISSAKNKSKFIKEFNKFYGTKLLGYPSLIIFEEGEVKDILTVKTGKILNIDKVVEFLNNNKDQVDYD